MRGIKIAVLSALIALLSGCQIFWGADPATSPEGILKSLWKDFDEMHAYLDIRMSNNKKFKSWDDVLNNEETGYIKELSKGLSLFEACGGMLDELGDPHVILYAPASNFYGFNTDSDLIKEGVWFRRNDIRNYYLNERGILSSDSGGFFLYGTFESFPSIGYIHISSFSNTGAETGFPNWVKQIDGIIQSLAHTDAIVLDIRANSGGLLIAAEYIAARFVSVPKDYIKICVKNGTGRNDFSPARTFSVKPAGTTYTKYIALLTNKTTVSAAEYFTMALRTQSHVKHMGTATRGAFSSRYTRSMINGWHYTISSDKVIDMDDNCYEGVGIRPTAEFLLSGEWDEWEEKKDCPDRQLNLAIDKIIDQLSL